MAATVEMLKGWFERGLEQKATHMIVACDTFDWEDYPVYVAKGEDARKRAKEYDGKNMQKVMEVYDLRKPWAEQGAGGTRVFNY